MSFGANRLMEMTAAQLRAFLAVAEYGGFSAAANQLSVSQPTISKAVKSLESKTGPLFERASGKSAILNSTGLVMRDEAPQVIQLFRDIERKIELMQQKRPLVRIAIGEYLYNRCREIVSQFLIDNPDINIHLEVNSSRTEAFKALRLGEVDIAFMSQFGKPAVPARSSSKATMKLYRSPNLHDSGARLLLPILNPQEEAGFLEALGHIACLDKEPVVVPNYFSIKAMCIAGQGQALMFEEDTKEEVLYGNLIESSSEAIYVTRSCFYWGESEILSKISKYLISSIN